MAIAGVWYLLLKECVFVTKIGGSTMTEIERKRQIAELKALQYSDPRHLINEYCRMTGEYCGNQMPRGASFSRMIDTIVDLRAATESTRTTTS